MAIKKETVITKGDKVKVDYTGTFDDGTVFDASEKHGQPLEFKVGSGQVIKGFDDAVVGMKKGQEKKIVIPPAEAYGEFKAELHKKVPRKQLPQDQEPKVGMILAIGLPNGQQFPARIITVTTEDVTIDLNHPLAGKTLHFKIKVAEVSA
ncbi:peptidylprolyl isomerase [Candidatus Woesearchaeota archaeon]|nr:peptidylprolyl isomerase [Candidatus Woesearchaeota archaeon]